MKKEEKKVSCDSLLCENHNDLHINFLILGEEKFKVLLMSVSRTFIKSHFATTEV